MMTIALFLQSLLELMTDNQVAVGPLAEKNDLLSLKSMLHLIG